MRVGLKAIPLPEEGSPARLEVESKRSGGQGQRDRGVLTERNYQCFVGAVNFIATVRPDIAFAINWLARYSSCPIQEAIQAGKWLLRYLKSTQELKHTFRGGKGALTLTAWSDSDWANDEETAVSVTGSAFLLAGAAVNWVSQKQKCVATSSSEAEYIAASETAREVVWLRVLLAGIGEAQPESTPLFMDNTTSIRFVKEDAVTPRRKHINVKYHYVREQFREGLLAPVWIETKQQLADLLTKALPAEAFTRFRNAIMGIRD